ncbi:MULTISPECIES: hypothetical protein [Pseudomonas]|uniref:hypothetical protein n=1 Tax=Pseudomonas TaxID=286 RepID=UPI00099C4E02|nr:MULTISPECIES: hypothetical protein [Pseudomonas]MCK3846063.1 hypothetical protein [Pseudomonas sp. W15Feb34]OPB11517.1 hypothetical protein BFW89_00150 [Pseudomonas synxantha]
MTRKHVFWFWGAMDALYLIRYAVTSAMEGRIPYLSDIESASWVLREHSVVQLYMFGFAMLLQVSIVLSCLLFFLGREQVRWVTYFQTPLRLAFIVPSVSLLLVGAQLVPNYNVVLMAVLVAGSEGVKVWSVWRWRKKS